MTDDITRTFLKAWSDGAAAKTAPPDPARAAAAGQLGELFRHQLNSPTAASTLFVPSRSESTGTTTTTDKESE
jgi:hypothetical protein